MEQIDAVLTIRLQRQLLEPRHKGRDTDAGTDPDLPLVLVFEGETAVWPFYRHQVAHVQGLRQSAGVVTQGFGDEADLRLRRVPGRGDGIRVRAFRFRRGDEGELTGLVPGPARLQCDVGFQHVQLRVLDQGLYFTLNLAPGSDAFEQRLERRQGATDQQQGGDYADRLGPVGELDQHHSMEHQHQVERGQDGVE